MDKFVFLSYKSDDRDKIRPYIAMLDNLGIKYWWDQDIDQEWGRDIDAKLNSCAAVIGFLTEKSTNSSPVFEECRTAVASNKFIPVKLDQSSMRYDFRSLIAFLNHIDLSSTSQQKNEAEKARLVQKIAKFVGTPLQPDQLPATQDEPPPFSLEKWITDADRLPHIAYLVSLCIFEGQGHDRIQMCSSLLEQQFTEQGLDKLLQINSSLTIKQAKLKLLGAESVKFRSETLQHDVDFIRFENHLLNEELLFYIWDELDQLKTPIIRWIEDLIERMPECINDIASSLSKIGRRNFLSIYSIFLHRWLRSKSEDKFRCADLTLSLMAGDANVRSYIRDRLFDVSDAAPSIEAPAAPSAVAPNEASNAPIGAEDGAAKGKTFITDDIAVALVTGFTGMAMPDLSIHVFKKIEANLMDPAYAAEDRRRTARRIRRGIDFILVRSKTDQYARAMLKVFATGIKSWALDDVENKHSLLPEFIFNILLSGLTVGRERDSNTISLADLLNEEGGFEPGTVNAFSMVIAGALESGNAHIREMYKDLFKDWVDQLARSKPGKTTNEELEGRIEADRQAFENLFSAALKHASTDSDKDRIRYLCKSICTL
jgi:hypothetical protein